MSGVLALTLAIGLVFGAYKLCSAIRAPLWFGKFLFIFAFLVVTYFLAEEIVPESKKPWDDASGRTLRDSTRYHSE